MTTGNKAYYKPNAMKYKYDITPASLEAASYVITTAVESGYSSSWFNFSKYRWKEIEGEKGETLHYAEVVAKMHDECEATWHDNKPVHLTPQVMCERMQEIIDDEEAPVHSQRHWSEEKGVLVHAMRNILRGDYGDGDATRDDGIMQVLFCKEVICS